MASGEVIEAFLYAKQRGMVEETKDDDLLFTRAAVHYADNPAKGVETLVVNPFGDEIECFNQAARAALRGAATPAARPPSPLLSGTRCVNRRGKCEKPLARKWTSREVEDETGFKFYSVSFH